MKKILLITTGGTIACIKTSNGLIPHATPEELLSEVEIVKTFCDPTGLNLMCIDSTDMLPSDWLTIAKCIATGALARETSIGAHYIENENI